MTSSGEHACRILDISAGGARIQSSQPLPDGPVGLSFNLPDGVEVRCTGLMVWSNPVAREAGVAFERCSAGEQRLAAFVGQ